ncbi:MAG: efflux RND transporter periplasmic adaptor subunit [Polyangiaceae bacterium]
MATFLFGCNQAEPPVEEQAAAPVSQPSRSVKVDHSLLEQGRIRMTTVVRRNPEDEIRATGTVTPDLDGAADVGALVTSTVRQLSVREGDRVTRGQVLAVLNAPDAARVAGELAKARSQRSRAERALAREEKLIARKATTDAELEQAQADLAGLRAEERAARLLLSAYGASGAQVQVRAPIAGVVAERAVELGSRVDSGERLFRIVDPAKLLVKAQVLERDATNVSKGDTALLIFPGGNTCSAQVRLRGTQVEPQRHSVSVWLEPRDCKLDLAGQSLNVQIQRPSAGGAKQLALPRDAVVDLDGTPVVFVEGRTPGEFEVEAVIVDHFSETTAFLSKGPAENRRVAVRGTILLKGEWMRSSME